MDDNYAIERVKFGKTLDVAGLDLQTGIGPECGRGGGLGELRRKRGRIGGSKRRLAE